jgi:hypothetical protein
MADFNEQEMRELVKQFEAFNRTLQSGSIFGDSTDKLVTALGVLGATLNSNNKSKRQEEKQIEEFKKRVNDSTSSTKKQTKATDEQTKATTTLTQEEQKRIEKIKESAKLTDEEIASRKKVLKDIDEYKRASRESLELNRASSTKYWESMNDSSMASQVLKDKFYNLAGDSKGLQGSLRLGAAAFEGITKSVTGYGKALYEGKRGAEVTAKAITDLVKPFMDLADSVGNILMVASILGGPLMFAAGLAIKGLSAVGTTALKYNEIAAQQNDKLFKSFNELSKAGITGAGGLTEVFSNLQRFGMTVAEIDNMIKILGENRENLSIISGFAAKGAKDFAAVAGDMYKSDIGKTFEKLGITQDQQQEGVMTFLTMQAKMGRLNLKNTEDVTKASAKYIEETEMLAELTGSTRKERQAANDAAMADDRFRAAQEHAIATGNEAKIQELANAKKIHDLLFAQGDKVGANAALQYGASGNATAAGAAFNLQYGGRNLIKGGAKSVDQLDMELVDAAQKSAKAFNGIIPYLDKGMVEGVQVTGAAKIADMAARKKTQRQVAEEAGFTGPNATADYLKAQQQAKAMAKDVGQNVEGNRAQQAAAMLEDSFVKKFNASATLHETATRNFATAVEKFGDIVGVDANGGTPSFNRTGPIASGTGSAMANAQQTVANPQSSKEEKLKAAQAAWRERQNEQAAVNGGSVTAKTRSISGQQKSSSSTSQPDESLDSVDISKLNVDSLLNFNGGISGNRRNFDSLDSSIKDRVLKAAVEYNQLTGKKILITSGARTKEEQQAVRGQRGSLAAEPGTSKHEKSMAVDIGNAGDPRVEQALLNQGLHNKAVAGEKWHFEKGRTGGLFSGPSTGYLIEAHDDEILLPANKGVSKQALGTASDALLGGRNEAQEKMVAILENMAEKYDTVINLLADGNDYSEKLVRSMS